MRKRPLCAESLANLQTLAKKSFGTGVFQNNVSPYDMIHRVEPRHLDYLSRQPILAVHANGTFPGEVVEADVFERVPDDLASRGAGLGTRAGWARALLAVHETEEEMVLRPVSSSVVTTTTSAYLIG